MAEFLASLGQVRVAHGICTSIAVAVTLIRLYVRTYRSKFGIEDVWVGIGTVVLVVRMASSFIDPTSRAGIARFYLLYSTFYASIWSARLSILCSILRLKRPFYPLHALYIVAALFSVAWAILTAQIYWECERQNAWKATKDRQCELSCAVGACQLITDVISDGLLLYFPIREFMTIRNKKLRVKLSTIYGTCIITTLISFVHVVYLLNHQPLLIAITAVVETTASIIVCNIPVLVTAAFKLKEEDQLPSYWDRIQTPPIPNPTDDGQTTTIPLRKIHPVASPA